MLRSFSLQRTGQQKRRYSLASSRAVKSLGVMHKSTSTSAEVRDRPSCVCAWPDLHLEKTSLSHSRATILPILAAGKRWCLSQRHYRPSASAAFRFPLPPPTSPALRPPLYFHLFVHNVLSASGGSSWLSQSEQHALGSISGRVPRAYQPSAGEGLGAHSQVASGFPSTVGGCMVPFAVGCLPA